MNTADSVSTFAASVGAGGAVVVMMLVWRAAMSKYSGWNRQTQRNVACGEGNGDRSEGGVDRPP